jgi:hypothetical protein
MLPSISETLSSTNDIFTTLRLKSRPYGKNLASNHLNVLMDRIITNVAVQVVNIDSVQYTLALSWKKFFDTT